MMDVMGIGMVLDPCHLFYKHSHQDFWEILCYTHGLGQISIEDETITFNQGTIVVIPPGFSHEERCDEGFMNYHLSLKRMDFPIHPHVFIDTPNHSFEKLMSILYQEYHIGRPQSEVLCSHLAATIVSFLHAWLPEQSRSIPVEQIKASLIQNISNCDFQIETHLGHVPFSTGYIRRLFKQETGETPLNYLTRLRLDYAKQLLSHNTSGFSINRVCTLCGFQDPYYFSRLFRKHTGVSPSQWRKAGAGSDNS